MRILALIPARGGSRRLKRKNIRLINERPMISYAIKAAKNCKLIKEVYVSTEDKEIAEIAEKYGAQVFERPERLAEDDVSTQEVFKHFAIKKDFDILVGLQANSPQITIKTINKAIKQLIDNKLWEVRAVNSEGLEHASVWCLTRKAVFWEGLSVYFGVVEDDSIDIHTKKDLKLVEKMMKNGKN